MTDGDQSAGGIERFEAPETEQITTFETDELTALCPFEFGGPDHYDLTVRYEADEYCLESKSLKLWLESYRDTEITAEGLADELYRDIIRSIKPARLYVRLEQARRGGIEETVEVGDRELR
jgi:7-cyano-7-deazaguanine reductase